MTLVRIQWLCPDCGITLATTPPHQPPPIPPICHHCGENLRHWAWQDLPIVRQSLQEMPVASPDHPVDQTGTPIDAAFPCDRCHAPCQNQDCFCEPCDGVFCPACYPIHAAQVHDDASFAITLATL